MSTYRQAHAYKAAAVTTATPGSLLLMLYDGALKFMRIADKAFDEEDPLAYNQTIHNNLIKAQNIVRELRSALIGGDDDQERIDLMVSDRWAAREAGDWEKADSLRDVLGEMGIVLKDGPDGSTWSRSIASGNS